MKDNAAGILASGSNGLKTDSSWTCGTMENDPVSWSNAYEIGTNGVGPWDSFSPGYISGISNDASWIWDSADTWNNDSLQQTVTCYRFLDYSASNIMNYGRLIGNYFFCFRNI